MTSAKLMAFLLVPINVLSQLSRKNSVGGQAIIEGVMMRGKHKVSWAVRKPDGELVIEHYPFVSITKKHKILGLPIFRGATNLIESLILGYKSLSRSADIASPPADTSPESKRKESFYSIISLIVALLISMGVFMYAPMWVLSRLIPEDSSILFNALAGTIRITLFLGYLVLISMWSEIRRIFEYHGAEHKAIFAYEDGKEANIAEARAYSKVHPRCGTSFILLVSILCVLLFSIFDALFIKFIGPYPEVFARFIVHLLLIPLVSGTSYELLKLSDKYQHIPIVGAMIQPGLWLQKITTREPDDKQLEVAISALKAAV